MPAYIRIAGRVALAIAAMTIVSCSGANAIADAIPVQPTARPTPTRSSPTSASTRATTQGWLVETYPGLDLSFLHPPDWSVSFRPAGEGPDPSMPVAAAFELTHPGCHMLVAFRPVGSAANMMGTGMPAGEFERRAPVLFLDAAIEKQGLIFEGKIKVLVYGPAAIGDYEYGIRVDAVGNDDYVDLEIPADLEAEVDAILSTFERIP